ncbi:MAG: caspase family protein, partial [Bacteroidota bacterium]
GSNIVIFPNYRDHDDRVEGGIIYRVPTIFRVQRPLGDEVLKVFVSTEKFPEVNGYDRGDGLYILNEAPEQVTGKYRSIGIFGEYAEKSFAIRTLPKSTSTDVNPPAIEITSPSGGEFTVTDQGRLMIEGKVSDESVIEGVALGDQPLAIPPQQQSVTFASAVNIDDGENSFVITAVDVHNNKATKEVVIKKEKKFNGQRWAVIVGVSEYEHKEIPDLLFAHRDAEAFAEFLKSPNGGAFSDDHVLLLTNEEATTRGVTEGLFSFLKETKDDDLAIVFFSGHGVSMGQDKSFLVTHDSDPYDLESTAFNMKQIGRAMDEAIAAERLILFTDACFSGKVNTYVKGKRFTVQEENLINKYLKELAKTMPGVLSFTSSDEGEISKESFEFGEHGIFTYFLISGLGGTIRDTRGYEHKAEPADQDGDGIVTVSEITRYVMTSVSKVTNLLQNPQVSQTEFDGNLPLSVIR